ncbi:MAG: hypothetical protein LBQ60_08730 [Bacteroidales bacterium]|jgi:hypothetical protein|nr:hypothetical protein [Bacteroidales bacterium]
MYPKYQLYRFVKKWDTTTDFTSLSYSIVSDFTNYFSAFYEYPTSPHDSIFLAGLNERFGFVPEIYGHDIFMINDTMVIGNNVENVIKIYLKGPNYKKKYVGQNINFVDYKEGLIHPVKESFFRFMFCKGDIFLGILPVINPCNNIYYRSRLAYKKKIDLDYSDVLDSFEKTLNPLFFEKYDVYPYQIQVKYQNIGFICCEGKISSDTLMLTQKCEPFNGEYNVSSMLNLLNKPLYNWAKEMGLQEFYFSIEVIPDFFEKKE